jgi:hypothetical protein
MFHYMVWLSLILSRVMRINKTRINMPNLITEMLCTHPVYAGPKSVKVICLSKLSIVRGGSIAYS